MTSILVIESKMTSINNDEGRIAPAVRSWIDRAFDYFEDFIRKTLITMSLVIGTFVVLLMYLVNLITDKTVPDNNLPIVQYTFNSQVELFTETVNQQECKSVIQTDLKENIAQDLNELVKAPVAVAIKPEENSCDIPASSCILSRPAPTM